LRKEFPYYGWKYREIEGASQRESLEKLLKRGQTWFLNYVSKQRWARGSRRWGNRLEAIGDRLEEIG
jgi:hypothetical protein